ncbi:endonuclease/exonuclease/phosphatase family protein [Sphingomonas flavalba]|uniref:endonuclease/exonuclease/phosphatase family protein n=1 Tax=Sphingomonas flavalba TaxID=2559804 RepID=UPI00109DFF5A|nr:endonuclease/exonuclease/phosphatase family protein [Sphingomonas flavalba]
MPLYRRALLCACAIVFGATGLSSGIVDDPLAPAVQRADERPLSVLTYNIAALPWPLASGRGAAIDRIAARLAAMRQAGRQPRIVLLQEAFTPEAARIARRAGYRHVATGADTALRSVATPTAADIRFLAGARWDRGEGWGKRLDSGLMILSDYPIVTVRRMAFPDFACAGFDCLANKGVLLAHLRVPGFARPVAVANTHLNARRASGVPVARAQQAYQRQVALTAAFIGRHVDTGAPLLLGGDMNIGKDPDRASTFFGAFARFGFVAPRHGGLRRALAEAAWTDDDARDALVSADRHGKDWIFARAADGTPMPVGRAHAPFGPGHDGKPLSDHVGYVIDYDPPPRLIARPAASRLRIPT